MFSNFGTMIVMWALAAINSSLAVIEPSNWNCSMAGFVVGLAVAHTFKWIFEAE